MTSPGSKKSKLRHLRTRRFSHSRSKIADGIGTLQPKFEKHSDTLIGTFNLILWHWFVSTDTRFLWDRAKENGPFGIDFEWDPEDLRPGGLSLYFCGGSGVSGAYRWYVFIPDTFATSCDFRGHGVRSVRHPSPILLTPYRALPINTLSTLFQHLFKNAKHPMTDHYCIPLTIL